MTAASAAIAGAGPVGGPGSAGATTADGVDGGVLTCMCRKGGVALVPRRSARGAGLGFLSAPSRAGISGAHREDDQDRVRDEHEDEGGRDQIRGHATSGTAIGGSPSLARIAMSRGWDWAPGESPDHQERQVVGRLRAVAERLDAGDHGPHDLRGGSAGEAPQQLLVPLLP